MQPITILILGISLIGNSWINFRQDNKIEVLQELLLELRWDYISHKKVEECRGLEGSMDYEGASQCYSNHVIYEWNTEGSHWQIYKEDNFDEHEIFRMKLNAKDY